MRIRDPKPDILRLDELARQVKAGDIKLPRFQRPFVWRKTDMLKLLDSIYKGYPIGSILIWHSSQQLTSERSISGLTINTEDNKSYPTDYLLDGQQRLTTLCGALFWDGQEEGSPWDIHFDLEQEQFIYPTEKNLIHLFPLNRLVNTSDFIRQCMKLEHHERGAEYLEKAERLLQSIKDYKIAVVRIGDMSLSEVAPIFERINSTGRKLTMVDLMMAATYSESFDLTTTIATIKRHCDSLGFSGLTDPIILRSIASAAGLGINKEDIQKLRTKTGEELAQSANSAQLALAKAIEFLREHINIHDFSYIPYGLQLTHLTEFFRICEKPSKETLMHLVTWFWYTSVTRYFGASNTGQNSKDLARIRAYATGQTGSLFERADLIDISRLLFDRFNLRNATSTTFLLLLNYLKPKTTIDGRPIDEGHLKVKTSRFYSNFAPQGSFNGKLNLSKILHPYDDDGPVQYVEGVPLGVHLLDDAVVDAVKKADTQGYFVSRSKIIAAFIHDLTGCNTLYTLPNEIFGEADIYEQDGIDEWE